jgi:hypothetical protein
MTCERLDGGRERVVSNGGGVHGEHVDARGDVAALSGTPLWVMGQKPYARVSEAGVVGKQHAARSGGYGRAFQIGDREPSGSGASTGIGAGGATMAVS